jgi:hypothetical protein
MLVTSDDNLLQAAALSHKLVAQWCPGHTDSVNMKGIEVDRASDTAVVQYHVTAKLAQQQEYECRDESTNAQAARASLKPLWPCLQTAQR